MSDEKNTAAEGKAPEANAEGMTAVDWIVGAGMLAVIAGGGFLAGRYFGGETVVQVAAEGAETAAELFS